MLGAIVVEGPKNSAPWWSVAGTTLAGDGTLLAFSSGGRKGAPLPIVCTNGVGVSTFFWDYIGRHFEKNHHVVCWDYRGHGASGGPTNNAKITMEDLARDLACVMDATAVERAILLGHSLGCQVILEFYRLFPERVAGLVPMLGAFGRPADTFLDPRIGRLLFEGAYRVTRRFPQAVGRVARFVLKSEAAWHVARTSGLVHRDLCRRSDLDAYLDHLARLDLGVFFEMLRAAQEHDAGPMLSKIEVPMLVVAGERDLFTPHHLSVEMASRVPRAELLEIPRGSHAALIEQPELINLRLEKFIRESVIAHEATVWGGKRTSTLEGP